MLDANYWAGGGGATSLILGAPRTFRLSTSFDFDFGERFQGGRLLEVSVAPITQLRMVRISGRACWAPPKHLALYLAHRGELVKYATTIVGDRAWAEMSCRKPGCASARPRRTARLDEPVGFPSHRAQPRRRCATPADRARSGSALVELAIVPEGRRADQASPEATAAAREELVLLREALAELPERTRIALEMRRFGGFKPREIAAHLGVLVTVAHEIVANGIAYCRQRVRPPS